MPEHDRLQVKHSGKSEKCWKALELVQTAEKYTASVDQQHKTQTSKQKKKKKQKDHRQTPEPTVQSSCLQNTPTPETNYILAIGENRT